MADSMSSTTNLLPPPLLSKSTSHLRGQPGSSLSSQSTDSSNNRHISLASSLSPSSDSTRSKQSFRKITRTLLPPPLQEPVLEDLSDLDPLEPEKFSPGETNNIGPKMSDGTNHYRDLAGSNPFRKERYTQFADMFEGSESTPTRSPTKHKPAPLDLRRKQPGLGQSQSDLGLRFYGLHGGSNMSRLDTSVSSRNSLFKSHETSLNSPPLSPVRGRGTTRTPSPIKYMDEIKEGFAYNPKDTVKRSKSPIKHLFGHNGFLGRSGSSNQMPNDTVLKNGVKSWFGKVKQRMGESSVDLSKVVHHGSPPESYTITTFAISLDPPTQAKLYSEIELMICATANQYLLIQHKEGRMSVESIIKITQFWCNKNRPQVIEFQFDQATQRDLVLNNMESFRFYGPNALDVVKINAMMQSWKTLAKEMGVRTFCTPDSVIKKHMHDCYKILELLGAPVVTFLAFQNIQIKALQVMREEQRRKEEYDSIEFGVERRWEPKERMSTDDEIRNPFE